MSIVSDRKDNQLSVLFVCMGNICRSPLAEGIFRHRLAERAADLDVTIDSAGTHSYHVGSPPDRRAQTAAARRGIDISMLGARMVVETDFEEFDYILVMDNENRHALLKSSAPEHHVKVRLFLDYSQTHQGDEVPDPYYGGSAGFERVIDLIEEATEGLLDELLNER